MAKLDDFEKVILSKADTGPIPESDLEMCKDFYLSTKKNVANTFSYIQCIGDAYFDIAGGIYCAGLYMTKKGQIEQIDKMDKHILNTSFSGEIEVPYLDIQSMSVPK